MTVSRNDHTVTVFLPSTTGEIESRCLHNCWTCKKLVYTDANGSVGIQCLERLNCSNGKQTTIQSMCRNIKSKYHLYLLVVIGMRSGFVTEQGL